VNKKVLPPIVSVQKKPNPRAFNAARKPERVPLNSTFRVMLLITMVAVPHERSSEVMSHEYFVVALTEN
jgi:hypothetical protein